MSIDYWGEEYGIRINQVAALKASDTIYQATSDYFEDGINVMDIKLLSPDRQKNDIIVYKITHESLKNDSRKLTDVERVWVENKLEPVSETPVLEG